MFSNRLTFAALAIACVAAAGTGGYFASRQNAVPAPAAAAETSVTAGSQAAIPVEETEAIVGESALKTPPTAEREPAATASGAPRRAEPARNTAPAAKPSTVASRQSPAPLDRSWPSGASSPSTPVPSASSDTADANTSSTSVDKRVAEAPRAPEPPQKVFEELVISANSVIGLQTENRISSETARVEDRVEARVTRDVKVGDSIAIPAGSHAIGSVTEVDRGGKFKDRARLGIRFTTVVLADGTRLPMSTETIYREGDAPGNASAAKIGGGAVGGAILGAILGGAKGAAIGATAGAGGGVAAVEAGDRREVTVPPGSPMTVRLLSPLTVTVEQQ